VRPAAIGALLIALTSCRGAPPPLSISDEAAARGFELAAGQTATLHGGR
jgi:hypothetical protein